MYESLCSRYLRPTHKISKIVSGSGNGEKMLKAVACTWKYAKWFELDINNTYNFCHF